jgi:hypothetical protein
MNEDQLERWSAVCCRAIESRMGVIGNDRKELDSV